MVRPNSYVVVVVGAWLTIGLIGCRKQVQPPPPPGPPGIAVAQPCGGVQRWDVKTASDKNVNKVVNPAKVVPTTVHDLLLRKKVNPWKVNLPRQIAFDAATNPAVEKTAWQINEVPLVKIKFEPDNDIHLIVRDRDPKFAKSLLTIEFPDTACKGAFDSPFKAQMANARKAVITACGNPPKHYKKIKGSATITGIGFFDKEHGAPSSTELHPAIEFQGKCK